MKRQLLSAVLSATIMISASACASAENVKADTKGTTIIYNGTELEFDTEPVNMDGTILVPMRAVFEALGTSVKWDSETQTVYARKNAKTYQMTLGENTITQTKNDEVVNTVTAEQAMQLVNDRTLIPLRALSELFDLDVDWNSETQTVTINSREEAEDEAWKENTGSINLTEMNTTGSGISVSGKVITINEGGDFTVSGTNEDAQIVIDTESRVKLRMAGAELTNTDGAAIYVKNADKLYITAEDGTTNTVSDGGEYSEDAETNACIYSKSDLEIKGKGVLNINGNVHNGITVKDSLDISNGNININAIADGIHVNDTAEITGGTINITSTEDGIQSESILNITDGSITISCTGEVTVTNNFGFGARGGQMVQTEDTEETEDESSKGIKAGWMMNISGGDITVNSNDTCVKSDSELNITGGKLTLTSESKKGIKGMEDVNITGGTIDIKKATEGIETKRVMTIDGGDISVIASDDGFNAGGTNGSMGGGFGGGMTRPEMPQDGTRPEIPQDGNMTRPEMTEDGIIDPETLNTQNADAAVNSGFGGRGQRGGMNADGMQKSTGGMGRTESTTISTEHHIQINGGSIYINSDGDGIDSNGSLVIDGGNVTVDGPASGGDSALDHDGLFQINGGTVIGVGSSGMIENPSETSAQNVISAYVTASQGAVITIKDSSGSEVCSYTVKKNTGHIMFSSDKLQSGETYTVYVDGTESASGTISGAVTVIGTTSEGMRGGFTRGVNAAE